MRTFCGLASYRTLPNKYKKESNNNEKQKQSKEVSEEKCPALDNSAVKTIYNNEPLTRLEVNHVQ